MLLLMLKEGTETETPAATRRIMAFEDFIKEKETTINKNVNYHDDDEEPEQCWDTAASKTCHERAP